MREHHVREHHMRIISGTLRGRRLKSPKGDVTRPTSDRVREALCSALTARAAFVDARVLDLFAGTGALGFEALSRGGATLVAIDRDPAAIACLRDNAQSLGVEAQTQIVQLQLLGPPARVLTRLTGADRPPFTLVFADPPYAELAAAVTLLAGLAQGGAFCSRALIALEHGARDQPSCPPCFHALAHYRYGTTMVELWETI